MTEDCPGDIHAMQGDALLNICACACASCHGRESTGLPPKTPKIPGKSVPGRFAADTQCSSEAGRVFGACCEGVDSPSQKLPFVPPVEGCEIEQIRRVGPFITHVRLRLPDGQPFVWNYREHRFRGGVRSLPAGTGDGSRKARWWHKIGVFARIIWWISVLFFIGAVCFGVSSAAGLAPEYFGAFGRSPEAINRVFFVGSIFFTTAAYLQFLAAVNADRISAIAHRRIPEGRFRWFALRPGEIGWLSAFMQLVGTVLFNVNTFDALLPNLDWLQEDLLIWTPDALGSVCFLVASALALLE